MEDPNPSQTNSLNTNNITNQNNHNHSITAAATTTDDNSLGYQLRALNENISAFEANPWLQAPTLPHSINVSSFSNELVNETLNYFVNCGTRLSQMTKTYDDNDAYLLLLQEKEVDLELAARIGQDLLKQNNDLKDSIKNLENELAKRQDDVQQLKHELASKTSLLDTFIEEEEHQTSLADQCDEDSTLRHQDQKLCISATTVNTTTSNKYLSSTPIAQLTDYNNYDIDEDGGGGFGANGFLSLNYNTHRTAGTSQAEPFSSLPYYLTTTTGGSESTKQLIRDDSNSTTSEELLSKGELPNTTNHSDQQGSLVQSVTFQLVESNKRLCELQDELFYKSEQNLLQQEKIYKLQEQIRESDRRLGDIALENQTLQKSMEETIGIQKELTDELKVCKRNFNELLDVFLELQKEAKVYRSMQESSKSTCFGEIDPLQDHHHMFTNNVSFDSFTNDTTIPDPYNVHAPPLSQCAACQHNHGNMNTNDTKKQARNNHNHHQVPMASSSLLEELQESMQKDPFLDATCLMANNKPFGKDCSSDEHSDEGEATDGCDSGVHSTSKRNSHICISNSSSGTSNNISSTTLTPSPTSGGLTDTDNDDDSDRLTTTATTTTTDTGQSPSSSTGSLPDPNNKRNWLGFSSFVLTTLILLCISATFNRSSSNFSLPQRLRIKLDR